MARYRKIDVMMWSDEKFLDLSDKGMLVFIFILTCPQQTSLGAMRATVDGLASEFLSFPGIQRSKWSLRTFRAVFRQISDKKMVFADEKAALIWLPNFLKHNRPTNINVVKSWVTVLETLPECETRSRIIEHILLFTKELEGDYLDAFKKRMQDTFGNKYLNKHLNKHGTNTPLVPKQTPKQTAIQEQEQEAGARAGAGTGDINRKQEQEHRNPHSTPMLLSDIIKENPSLSPPTLELLNSVSDSNQVQSWAWWKARLEEIQMRVWGTIGLTDQHLITLIQGEDGRPGFGDPEVLYLAIAQTKKKPISPLRYLQTKAQDEETVHKLRKRAGRMKDEDFQRQ